MHVSRFATWERVPAKVLQRAPDEPTRVDACCHIRRRRTRPRISAGSVGGASIGPDRCLSKPDSAASRRRECSGVRVTDRRAEGETRSWLLPLSRWLASGARRAGARWRSRLVGSSRSTVRARARSPALSAPATRSGRGRPADRVRRRRQAQTRRRLGRSGVDAVRPARGIFQRARGVVTTSSCLSPRTDRFFACRQLPATPPPRPPSRATRVKRSAHTSPVFLPDGRRFLYAVGAEDRTSGAV